MGVEPTSVHNKEDRMFRKSTLALAAVAALGMAAFAPTPADASWRGYGWYGGYYQPYPYGGFYRPRYAYGFYGPRYHVYGGWRKFYRNY
jgi:hypothetical protein